MRSRSSRPPRPLRLLRGVAALALLGLVGLVAYEALRAAGFRFRWEADPEVLPPPLERVEPDASAGGRAAPIPPRPRPEASAATPPAETGSGRPDVEAGESRAERRVGRGAFAAIDFERYPDGSPVCAPCPAGEEWVPSGVRFSFRSWSADARRPSILDARNFLPDDASTYALGPAFAEARGLEVGVIRLDFPDRPRRVAFTLYGPDLIDRFAVAAWSDAEPLPGRAVARRVVRSYRPVGRAEFREERILVAWPEGIDRIELDGWGPPGHVLLIDDLAIEP